MSKILPTILFSLLLSTTSAFAGEVWPPTSELIKNVETCTYQVVVTTKVQKLGIVCDETEFFYSYAHLNEGNFLFRELRKQLSNDGYYIDEMNLHQDRHEDVVAKYSILRLKN